MVRAVPSHIHIVLLIVALIGLSTAYGQRGREIDTTVIKSYVDKIIIKANISTELDSYTLKSQVDNDFKLITNNQVRLFLSLDYEFIGVSLGFAPEFIPSNADDDLKGESSFNDFTFRFFLGNWTQEIRYSQVEGYYVENTGDFLPDWTEGEDPFIQFPNVKTTYWGGSTSYVFNPNFSLRNVVYNTEWQLKSAGSFVPTFRYGLVRLSATIDDSKIFEDNYDFILSPSYYYTWVIQKNWFISPFLSPSIGVRFSKDVDEATNTTETNTFWPMALEGGLQLGYSSPKIIFGGNLNLSTSFYSEDSQTNVNNDTVFVKVYFGYRFGAPKFVKKTFDWAYRQVGM